MIPYAKQSISSEDVQAVSDVLRMDFITRGVSVETFEQKIAEYCGARYAVSFNSGSSALSAAYQAVDVSHHDRLVTTPNTFVATIAHPWSKGVIPTFIDIDRDTGNLDLNKLKDVINMPKTRGKSIVAPVHFSGIAVDVTQIEKQIKDPETIIIEDAAHAFGSSYPDGAKVGSSAHSHMTIFSFHPAKTITTGEGGMVVTNDELLFKRLRRIRNNGIEKDHDNLWGYRVEEISGNYHLTDIQAALGLSQLQRLDGFVENRRHLVKHYRESLKGVSNIKLLNDDYDDQTAFHLFVTQIDFETLDITRQKIMQKLQEAGIGTQVHYIPLYKHPFFTKIRGDISESFPEMEAYYTQTLSLPLYPDLSLEDVDMIVDKLCHIINR